jgi:NTE family protein
VVSRAVVLGGGGQTGFGWQWGIVTGLWEAGIRLADADLVIGTSAGSMVAAHLTCGVPPGELMATVSAPHEPFHPLMALKQDPFVTELIRMVRAGYTQDEIRADFGRLTEGFDGGPEDQMRAIAEHYLPDDKWPEQRMLIPAIDVATGELRTFDRDSEASLVDAVSASCAIPCVWNPVTIGDRRYMDAVIRSPINADLAAGYDRVVVIAVLPEIRGVPGGSLAEQIAPVQAHGEVVVVTPDEPARAAIGRDQQDMSQRPAAARAGLAQVSAVVDALTALWKG